MQLVHFIFQLRAPSIPFPISSLESYVMVSSLTQVPRQEQGGRGGEQGQARDRRVCREEEERRARVPQEDRRRACLQVQSH